MHDRVGSSSERITAALDDLREKSTEARAEILTIKRQIVLMERNNLEQDRQLAGLQALLRDEEIRSRGSPPSETDFVPEDRSQTIQEDEEEYLPEVFRFLDYGGNRNGNEETVDACHDWPTADGRTGANSVIAEGEPRPASDMLSPEPAPRTRKTAGKARMVDPQPQIQTYFPPISPQKVDEVQAAAKEKSANPRRKTRFVPTLSPSPEPADLSRTPAGALPTPRASFSTARTAPTAKFIVPRGSSTHQGKGPAESLQARDIIAISSDAEAGSDTDFYSATPPPRPSRNRAWDDTNATPSKRRAPRDGSQSELPPAFSIDTPKRRKQTGSTAPSTKEKQISRRPKNTTAQDLSSGVELCSSSRTRRATKDVDYRVIREEIDVPLFGREWVEKAAKKTCISDIE